MKLKEKNYVVYFFVEKIKGSEMADDIEPQGPTEDKPGLFRRFLSYISS